MRGVENEEELGVGGDGGIKQKLIMYIFALFTGCLCKCVQGYQVFEMLTRQKKNGQKAVWQRQEYLDNRKGKLMGGKVLGS